MLQLKQVLLKIYLRKVMHLNNKVELKTNFPLLALRGSVHSLFSDAIDSTFQRHKEKGKPSVSFVFEGLLHTLLPFQNKFQMNFSLIRRDFCANL